MKSFVKSRIALSAVALGAALVASNFAYAAPDAPQGNGDHAKGAKGGPMRGLLADLNLTDAQKAQIKEIMEAQKPKREAIRNDTTLSPQDKRKQLQALREDTMTKIRAILTPEQQAKLDAAIAEQKANRPKRDKPAA